MAITSEQKRRVAEYVLRQMAQRGWDRARLTIEAQLDPQTVRTFLQGDTWPQTGKRQAIERALGVGAGTLELVAQGIGGAVEEDEGDPVERAISQSELTRANKAKLIGTYYEMLDGQGVRGA